MTRQEAIDEMSKMNGGDKELEHIRADEILCQILSDLGYGDVVEAYENVDKWHA